MALPRAQSVAVGLATAAGVWMIYNNSVPPIADVRVGDNNDADASAAEKRARWTSALVVIGVSLLTADMTVFVIGGVAIIAESWCYRHANMYDAATRQIVVPAPRVGGMFGLSAGPVAVQAGASAGI